MSLSSLPQRDQDAKYLGSLIAGLPSRAATGSEPRCSGRDRAISRCRRPFPDGTVLINPETSIRVETKKSEEKGSAKISYEDIGGLGQQIRRIREMIELPLRHPRYSKIGDRRAQGRSSLRAAGDGKTLIARAVANETDAYFNHISGPEIMGKFYGESEGRLRGVFERQAHTPAIIFIDEIDAIAPKREAWAAKSRSSGAWWPSFWRCGWIGVPRPGHRDRSHQYPQHPGPGLCGRRFDREISVPIPDKTGGCRYLRSTPGHAPGQDVSLEKLAEITHGFVGADLEASGPGSRDVGFKADTAGPRSGDGGHPLRDLAEARSHHGQFRGRHERVEPSATREFFVEVPDVKWEEVGGLEDIREELKEAVEWPLKYADIFKGRRQASQGILLTAPGHG